jgi:hypothetical protein
MSGLGASPSWARSTLPTNAAIGSASAGVARRSTRPPPRSRIIVASFGLAWTPRMQRREKLTFNARPSQNARGEDAMDDATTIEPFGFFTLDALRAGWYLFWRQLIRMVPAILLVALAGFLLASLGFGVLSPIVTGFGVLAVLVWGGVLTARLTMQWAEQWYGVTLTGALHVWWGVTWRVSVASLVAAVICTPPNFVALSLTTSSSNSALGLLGSLLAVLLGGANTAATVLATGWAMSKVATAQIATLTAVAPAFAAEPAASDAVEPALEPEPVGAPVAVAAPIAVARAPAVARPAPATAPTSSPRPAAAADARQCPKCGLYETERGSVIGWYCRICGWREGKR